MKERLALDVGNWRAKTTGQIARELATANIEQGEASLERRVTYLSLPLDIFNSLQPSWKNRTDWQENAAYFKIRQWARQGGDDFLLWISPPEPGFYPESRFGIYYLNQNQIEIWGICENSVSPSKCLEVAEKLGYDDSRDPGILRCTPIFFRPSENQTWFDFLRPYFGNDDIWQEIVSGRVQSMSVDFQQKASLVLSPEMELKIRQARTYEQRILVGAELEQLMAAASGRKFQAIGSCGISNQAQLGVLSGLNRAAAKVEFKDGQKIYYCPICGVKVKAGEKCPVSGCNWQAPA